MTVFDWLQGVALPSGVTPFDAVEVRFKANRKAFFRKPEGAEVYVGDVVVVEADPGTDVGVVTLTGELVRAQMKARKLREDADITKIRRRATQEDIDVWQQARLREADTVREARRIIQGLRIEMEAAPLRQPHRLQAIAPLIAAQGPRLMASSLEPDLGWLPLTPPAGPAPQRALQQAINMALQPKQFALQ
jgi:ribosomal protein L21